MKKINVIENYLETGSVSKEDNIINVNENENISSDYLDAILAAALYFGKPSTPSSVARMLPLSDGRVPAHFLAEAASNAGLSIAETSLNTFGFKASSFPLIVELGDGRVLCLLKKDTKGFIIGGRTRKHGWISINEMKGAGVKLAFQVRPAFYFDDRSLHFDLPKYGSWFMGPLRANAWIYFCAALATIVISIAAVALSMFSMAVYDRVIPNNSIGSLVGMIVGVGIVLAGDFVLKIIRGNLIEVAAQRFDVHVGSNVFAQLLSVNGSGRPASAGTTANLVREFDTIRDFFTSATLIILADLPFALLFIALVWWFAGPLAYVPIAAAVFITVSGLLIQWPMADALKQSFREAAQRSAFIHEVAASIDSLKTANASAWARRQWEHYILQSSHSSQKVRHLSLAFSTLSGTTMQVATVAVVAFGAVLASRQEITTGGIIAATLLTGRCLAPFSQIAVLMSRWQQTRLAYTAIDNLMKAKTDNDKHNDMLQHLHIRGEIEFHSTAFSYPQVEGQFAPSLLALQIDQLKVNAGEAIGVIGRVGSGKSTLLKLITRLIDPQSGNVKIDGIDARQIHPAELRRQVGYHGQETALFHGSIRDNIVLGKPDATDDEILAVCELVGLTELMSRSALGLATPVGERGQFLSGGQRQLVTLARAIIGNPPILLLDEPTSMMDNTTEAAFLGKLSSIRHGKTTIIVTHRPQILTITRRVVVLDAGKIVADGPREDVIAALSGAKPKPVKRGA